MGKLHLAFGLAAGLLLAGAASATTLAQRTYVDFVLASGHVGDDGRHDRHQVEIRAFVRSLRFHRLGVLAIDHPHPFLIHGGVTAHAGLSAIRGTRYVDAGVDSVMGAPTAPRPALEVGMGPDTAPIPEPHSALAFAAGLLVLSHGIGRRRR